MVQLRNTPRKSEKYLSSRTIHLDDLRRSVFKGTNGSARKLSQKSGEFTSDNVTLLETAINNNIVRIPLKRFNLKDLKAKICTRRSFGKLQKSTKVRRQRQQRTVNPNGLANISIPLIKLHTSKKNSVTENGRKPEETVKHKELSNKNKDNSKKSLKIKRNISSESVNVIRKAKKGDAIPKSTTTKLEMEMSSRELLLKTKPNKAIQRFDRSRLKIRLYPNKPRGKKNDLIINLKKSETSLKMPSRRKNSLHPLRYCLKFENQHPSAEGKLNYEFKKLVTDVQNNMKLPSPTWKIKIMIKQNKVVSAITFTNKLDLERSVNFSAETGNYHIIIDNEPALLIGSPQLINNAQDIEILLDIIENIQKYDPMILYK